MKVRFHGKYKKAIGCYQSFVTEVEANTLEEARMKLYDIYDHIFWLREIKEEE